MEVIFKRWHMAWERNEYQDHKQQMSVLLRSKINPLEVLKWFKIFWQVEANFQSSRKNSEISKNLQHMPRTCFGAFRVHSQTNMSVPLLPLDYQRWPVPGRLPIYFLQGND